MFYDEFITVSLLIGVLISLGLTEVLGVSPGGMVVVGFLAPQLARPLGVLGTVATALVTYLIVRTLSRFLLVYGRRRLVLVLLVAVFVDALLGNLVGQRFAAASLGFASIGRIVPGLLANAFDGQGVPRTLGATALGLSITGLLLVVIAGVLPIPIGRNVF
jgi:poly-gamma-glutamate biosynthesis protein PgsC/CapC